MHHTSVLRTALLVLGAALWLTSPAWAQTATWPGADLPQNSRTSEERAGGTGTGTGTRTSTGTGTGTGTGTALRDDPTATGPVRLLPNGTVSEPQPRLWRLPAQPYEPSEFEKYVQSLADLPAPERFGAHLLADFSAETTANDPLTHVPGDYLVKPGDEVRVVLWGSVDADLNLTVDRSGRIALPRVGAIGVAGVRMAELENVIGRRVGQVFRNYQLSVSVGQLRPIRVFVTGYVQRPGSITLPGGATALHAILRAGGPGAAGSFRDIQLRRSGLTPQVLDLYALLTRGERGSDLVLQPDDVIHVGPVGPQVGLIGAVNQPAVFELRQGETLADVLQFAGGFSAVADRSRLTLERLADRNSGRVTQLVLPSDAATPLAAGDVVRAFSAISVATAREKRNQRVRVEGEVLRPGDYVLPPGSTMADALQAAGGLTSGAYIFGTEFSRESVRLTQQENYDRALRDMETELTRSSATRRASTGEEIAAQSAGTTATQRLIERLRLIRPTGRVVLQMEPSATALPNLALEDGDRILIPAQSTSVGIYGSVFNTGSYLYQHNQRLGDYLKLAGGPTRGADTRSIFVIRANGTVVSARQGGSFFWSGGDLGSTSALPGDTIFVPEEMDKTTLTQDFKDWTQILYQFGLGVAGIKAVGL